MLFLCWGNPINDTYRLWTLSEGHSYRLSKKSMKINP